MRMLIRCKKCDMLNDLKTRTQIENYINGVPIRCKKCKTPIYFKQTSCEICGETEADNYYKDKVTDQIICEECLLEIDMIGTETTTQYFLDGEYIGDSNNIDQVIDSILDNTDFEKMED